MKIVIRTLVIVPMLICVCCCSQIKQWHEERINKKLDAIYYYSLLAAKADSNKYIISNNPKNREFYYLMKPSTIIKYNIDKNKKESNTILRGAFPVFDYILGTCHDGVYAVCEDNNCSKLVLVMIENNTLVTNDVRLIDQVFFYNSVGDKLVILSEADSCKSVSEIMVRDGELLESPLYENVWTAWNEPVPNGVPWNESTMGHGGYVLVGLNDSTLNIKEKLVSDNYSWSINETKESAGELEHVYVYSPINHDFSSLKDLIQEALNKVSDSQKVETMSPFAISYGESGLFTSQHVISVITGKEYTYRGIFNRLSNSAKVLWYYNYDGDPSDRGLNSINIINDTKENHGVFVSTRYRSSYIELKDKVNNIKYLDYYGTEIPADQIEDESLGHAFFKLLFGSMVD